MKKSADQRRKTAIHESGHVVAAIRLGHACGALTICPDFEAGLNGNAEFEPIRDYDVELASEELIISCAGYAALAVFGYDEADSKSGAERDFEEAEELIQGFNLICMTT